jgi:hypothetical protein
MRELAKEIEAVLKTVIPSPPIYRVKTDYSGIRLSQVFKPTVTSTSFLAGAVIFAISEELDISHRCNRIRNTNAEEIANSVRYSVRSTIINFLRDYQDTKNNKLTTLYRWYNEFLDNGRLKNDVQFDNDMYNLYKFIKTSPTNYQVGDKFPNGIISVLGALKQRYEAKGIKL